MFDSDRGSDPTLIRTREIRLTWDGDKICALAGQDLQSGIGGFGDTVAAALTDLAAAITRDPRIEVRVPQCARQCIEEGVQKTACPECKYLTEQPPTYEIYTYTCRGCGLISDLEPLPSGGG